MWCFRCLHRIDASFDSRDDPNSLRRSQCFLAHVHLFYQFWYRRFSHLLIWNCKTSSTRALSAHKSSRAQSEASRWERKWIFSGKVEEKLTTNVLVTHLIVTCISYTFKRGIISSILVYLAHLHNNMMTLSSMVIKVSVTWNCTRVDLPDVRWFHSF